MLKSSDVLASIVTDEGGRPIFIDTIYERYVQRMPEGSRMANKDTAKKLLGGHPDIEVNKQDGQGCIQKAISYQSADRPTPTITITETRYVDKVIIKKQWAWAPYRALATLVVIGAIAGYFARGI